MNEPKLDRLKFPPPIKCKHKKRLDLFPCFLLPPFVTRNGSPSSSFPSRSLRLPQLGAECYCSQLVTKMALPALTVAFRLVSPLFVCRFLFLSYACLLLSSGRGRKEATPPTLSPQAKGRIRRSEKEKNSKHRRVTAPTPSSQAKGKNRKEKQGRASPTQKNMKGTESRRKTKKQIHMLLLLSHSFSMSPCVVFSSL